MTEDLAAWLLEQIDDDERVARDGFSNQGDPENGWGTEDVVMANPVGMRPATSLKFVVTPHVGIIHEEVQRAHVVRWNPARVLAECDAKRRIVALHTPGDRDRDCPECTDRDYRGSAGMPLVWCDTLKLLAEPYGIEGRPGYREEWRP